MDKYYHDLTPEEKICWDFVSADFKIDPNVIEEMQKSKEITDTDRIQALGNLLNSNLNTDGEKVMIFQDYPREYYIIGNQGRHFYGKALREALDNLIEKNLRE